MGVISGQAAEVLQWSKTAYMGSSLSFYFALGLIILGNGLFKSPVATMVGMFYREAGAHKDAGYTLYYMAVNLGSFVAPLIVGLVGEYYGWHLGFTLAGIGMLCGLTLLLWKQRLLGEVGEKLPVEDRHHHMELTPLTSVEKQRLIALLVFIVFATLFIAAYEHTGGLMNLFLLDDTNRVIGDFVVPTTWFQSLNPLLVIAGAPVLAWLWVELAKLGRSPQMPIKFVIGFVVLAFSYLFMIFAALELVASADGKSGMLWVVLWYFFLTLAELIVLPLYYSSLNTMAPKRYSAMIMGCGLLALSIGSWLASRIGAWVVEQSYLTGFIFLALFTLGAATLPWALNTRLKRWMHLDHP
jgi:POT family proton-dependent oligopeptide transporter